MDNKGICVGGVSEHDEAAIWTSLIANSIGADAMVVPDGTIKQKTTFINSWSHPGDIAVEVHFSEKNTLSIYTPGNARSQHVAQRLQIALSQHLMPNNEPTEGWYRDDANNGVEWFLDNTNCTAVIIAPEITGSQEVRSSACNAVANTLKDFCTD